MSFFSVQALQEKLNRLTLSQDSIETLSLWIIHHKTHAKDSVDAWLEDVKKGDPDRRLMLFYLANDVLQNGRRRGADLFLELFKDPLRQAVKMISGQKIQTSVERMFRIWKDRKVYNNQFLHELATLIEPTKPPSPPSAAAVVPVVVQPSESPPDFKVSLLEDAITEFRKFEAELKVKSSHLANLRVNIKNPASSLSQLKDKSEGGRVSGYFDDASQKLQEYCECLVIDVNERINILELLKECKSYQTHTLNQYQKMVTDYQTLEKSLESLKESLQSRMKELERAQCTATSDPVSKDDITDIGDMEIESDNESQDSTQAPPPLTVDQLTAKPAIPFGPGHFQTRPPLQSFQPVRYQQPRPPGANVFNTSVSGNILREPAPGFPVQAPPTSQLTASVQPRPLLMNPNSSFPRSTSSSQLMQTVPSSSFGPPAELNTPSVGAPPTAPSTIPSAVSLPLKNERSSFDGTTTVEDELSPSSNKPTLDERLQNMVAHKLFGNVVEYSDSSGSESKDAPYSPSADELPVSANTSPPDDDQVSIPTPNTGNVTPDNDEDDETSSPHINLNNPILQALYKSQESSPPPPERATPVSESQSNSVAQTQPIVSSHSDTSTKDSAVLSTMNTSYLQEILNNVKSVASSQEPAVTTATTTGQTSMSSFDSKVKPQSKAVIKDIPITPKLTNLLDQIFPQLSKSLQRDRKRKSADIEEQSSNDPPTSSQVKHPRLTNDHPVTATTSTTTGPSQRMLTQQQRPVFSSDVNSQSFPPPRASTQMPYQSSLQGDGLPPARFRAPPPPGQMTYPPYSVPRPSFSPRPNHMPSVRPVGNFQQHEMKPRAPRPGYGPRPSIGRGGPLHNQGMHPPMMNFRSSVRSRFV